MRWGVSVEVGSESWGKKHGFEGIEFPWHYLMVEIRGGVVRGLS